VTKAELGTFPDRLNTVSAWHARMLGASRSSDRFKKVYYWLYLVSALAAASVPALIAAAGSSDAPTANVMRFFAAGLGVVVALATSVLGVVQSSATDGACTVPMPRRSKTPAGRISKATRIAATTTS
jgi:hypothetical protein